MPYSFGCFLRRRNTMPPVATPIIKKLPNIISLEVRISVNNQNELSSLFLKRTIATRANSMAMMMVFGFITYSPTNIKKKGDNIRYLLYIFVQDKGLLCYNFEWNLNFYFFV